jgi:SNF2 family DNA or RNA helicase
VSFQYPLDGQLLTKIPTVNLQYVGTHKDIPDLPSIIVVPGNLIAQWRDEIHTFFLPKSLDVLIYPNTLRGREEFWSNSGPWKMSTHDMRRRVVLVAHQVSHF